MDESLSGYPSSLLSEPWRTIYGLNPMVAVVEGFRWALLGTATAPGPIVGVSALAAVCATDVVVVVTNHKVYDYKAILDAAKFIFDSRNALGKMGKNSPKAEQL